MTPDLLETVGLSLYGRDWQATLARVLNVSERSVRRWRTGEHRMNAWAAGELAALCEQRSQALAALAPALRAHARALEEAEATARAKAMAADAAIREE